MILRLNENGQIMDERSNMCGSWCHWILTLFQKYMCIHALERTNRSVYTDISVYTEWHLYPSCSLSPSSSHVISCYCSLFFQLFFMLDFYSHTAEHSPVGCTSAIVSRQAIRFIMSECWFTTTSCNYMVERWTTIRENYRNGKSFSSIDMVVSLILWP